MELECNCSQISIQEWERKMKGIRPISYKWLVAKIKKHLPLLYEDLCLNIYNPYENNCGVTDEYYILCHSAIEYFIRKH